MTISPAEDGVVAEDVPLVRLQPKVSLSSTHSPKSQDDTPRRTVLNKASLIRLASLLVGWYSTSVASAKLNVVLMNRLGGSPIALSVFQQMFIISVGMVMLRKLPERPGAEESQQKPVADLPMRNAISIALPLGLYMTLLSISYNMAMLFIPVSFLNTIKSSIPIWTCLTCWFFYGQQFSILTKLSLIPIVTGVALASFTELGFHPVGFILASFSALNQTLFNLRTKRILTLRLLTRMQVQVYTAIVSVGLLLCIWIILFIFNPADDLEDVSQTGAPSFGTTVFIMLLCGSNYFIEMMINYSVISLMSSLAYSIADVVRRLIVIVAAIFFFGNPVNFMNIAGVCIALGGVVLYNLSTSSYFTKMPRWALRLQGDASALSSYSV